MSQIQGETRTLVSSPDATVPKSHWIFRYRGVESLLFLILNYLAWNGNFDISKTHEIQPPSVSVSVDGVNVNVMDPSHGFPLRVGGEWCYASDFQACASSDDDVNFCCHGHYEQTIDGVGEKQIFYLLPLIFLVVRHFVLRYGLKVKDAGYTIGHHSVGLLACWLFVYLGTDVVKSFVGYPRPNFYALQAYGELHDSSGAIEKSYVSFPSGHASTSMSTMLYISLVQLCDLKLIALKKNVSYSIGWRGLFCFMPVYFSVWVGSTRIVDYFHAPADVLAGFLLGAITGLIAFINFVPDFLSLELKYANLEKQKQQNKVYGSSSISSMEQGITEIALCS